MGGFGYILSLPAQSCTWILIQEGDSSLGCWEGPGGAPAEGVAAEALPPKTGKNPSHRALCAGNPAPASACTVPQREPRLLEKAALREVCADYEVYHTNTAVRVHPERRAIALPGHATFPMNTHEVLWCPALGSLKFEASAVRALALFHPCEPHRAVPGPPLSAPAVASAPWPNNSWQIPGFPNCSLGAAVPPG